MTEAPTTTESTEAELKDEVQDIEISGVENDTFVSVYTVGKGRAKGKTQLFLQPNEGESFNSFHNRLRKVVGEENWDKQVQAMVRQACIDSTNQAIKESADGKLTDIGFSSAFTAWHLPATRRGGTHIKDLREKTMEIFSELNPLLRRHWAAPKPEDPGYLNDEERNRMIQLSLSYSDIQAQIESKTRKGKTAEKAK